MKHLINFGDPILERLGVPDQTKYYVENFINEIKSSIVEILLNQNDDIEQTISNGKKAARSGQEIKKIPLPKDSFEGNINIKPSEEHKFSSINYKVNISFVPNGGWGDENIVCEGAYLPNFTKPGNLYSIDVSLHIQYNMNAHMQGIKNIMENIIEEVEATMYHELNHAYEDYMRKSHENIGLMVNSGIKKSVAKLQDYFEVPAAKHFFYLIYLSISTEINARIPSIIPQIEKLTDPAEKIKVIENCTEWKFNNMLLTFNAEDWIQSLGQELSMGGILPRSITIQGIEETINGMMDLITAASQNGGEGFLEAIKENFNEQEMPPVEDISKQLEKQIKFSLHLVNKDPIEYFQYWQRVFNERGEYARRKMLRLASY